jgi:hypothetical protein
MPPRTASRSETYSPYLTDPNDAHRAVEVKQNIPRAPLPIKGTHPDLQSVIAHIHALGLHLVTGRELRDANGGRP